MASSVPRTGNNAPNGAFIPEIWSKKMLKKFYSSTVLTEVTNTDYEGEISGQGSKVIIRIKPTVNIGDYTVNGTINYQDLQDNKTEFTIDKAKYYAFKIDDVDKAQMDINLMNEATTDAAFQLKLHIEKQLFGQVWMQAGTTTASQQITKLNVLDWVVDAGTKLDELNIGEEGRFLVVPPWIAAMIKKSDLKDASLSGEGSSTYLKGKIGMLDRFTLYNSNNLWGGAATVGVPQQILAGTKDAITFASQFVKTENTRLQDSFGDAIRGLKVYGYKTILPQALIAMPAYK
jgi:hypothetical protein